MYVYTCILRLAYVIQAVEADGHLAGYAVPILTASVMVIAATMVAAVTTHVWPAIVTTTATHPQTLILITIIIFYWASATVAIVIRAVTNGKPP